MGNGRSCNQIKISGILTSRGEIFPIAQAQSYKYDVIRGLIRRLDSSIRIYYFLNKLHNNEKLEPILMKKGRLIDGMHRIWAHILYGSTEVEYVEEK